MQDIIDEFLSQFENAEKSEVVSNSWIETYSDEEARFLFNDCWRFLMELTEAGVVTTQLELIIFFY